MAIGPHLLAMILRICKYWELLEVTSKVSDCKMLPLCKDLKSCHDLKMRSNAHFACCLGMTPPLFFCNFAKLFYL